jgi:hypothetical protein
MKLFLRVTSVCKSDILSAADILSLFYTTNIISDVAWDEGISSPTQKRSRKLPR